jgi:hypothetical protein
VLDVVAAMPTRARPEVLALLAEVASAMEVEEDVCVP